MDAAERKPNVGTRADAPLDVYTCPLDGVQLVEASAGTGKTWNLCGLVLRLLLERGLALPQILVVTFTNAATAELRERIRARLVETRAALEAPVADAAPGNASPGGDPFVQTLLRGLRARRGPDEQVLKDRLDAALASFDEAAIYTIHAFCQRALADAPLSSGMPLVMQEVADPAELLQEVMGDFWRRRVADPALPAPLAATLMQRGDTPATWAEQLKRHLARPMARTVWPGGPDSQALGADGQATVSALDAALHAAHAAARALWRASRHAVLETMEGARAGLNGRSYGPDAVDKAAAQWDALLQPAQPLAAPPAKHHLHLLATRGIKMNKGHAAPCHPFFDAAQVLLDAHAAAAQTLALARLALLREGLEWGEKQARARQRARRGLAFDDMLFNLHQRLTGSQGEALTTLLRARWPAALIDEFQDTDALQWAIFRRLHGQGAATLFLVGDPKQAIYGFRHADLHTYLHARQTARATWTINQSQRATPELLAGLNALFGANPAAFMLRGLHYPAVVSGERPRRTLVDTRAPRHGCSGGALQLWHLQGASGLDVPLKADAHQAALWGCAGEIAGLLAATRRGELMLGDKPLAAGDIAVLVRTHRQGRQMREALAALGVGSVERSQASLFDSPEAEDVERVLGAVLQPRHEGLVRAALATVLMGRDAADLAALAADETRSLALLARFAGWRETWLRRGAGVMLRQVFAAEHVAERLLARPDGERRLTNLLHLAECLHEAAGTHAAPEALLRWLQRRRAEHRSGDEATQLRLESDRDLVQVVTIHAAKGLEYPFVFCPFLWDGATQRKGVGESRDYHDAFGDSVVDFRPRPDKNAADDARRAQQAIDAQIALERAAETLRLIYVALTRASHRCVLVVGRYQTRSGRGVSNKQSAGCLLNWLVSGAGVEPADWLARIGDPKGPQPTPQPVAWQKLADAHPHAIRLSPLPGDPVVLAPDPTQALRTVAARVPPAAIEAPWRLGSYTSLAHGIGHEAAADHDLHVGAGGDPSDHARIDETSLRAAAVGAVGALAPSPPVDADDILRFPRGAQAGVCLHAVFERADFGQPGQWDAAIDQALRAHPPQTADAAATVWPAMLRRMLNDVLHTPLLDGFSLSALPPRRRLVELEFHLPVPRLGAAGLEQALRTHGYALPGLAFGSLRGYLRGFIDLVFEQGGRWYVLDWKSNHLGDTPAHYGAERLARVMAEQAYHLQGLLYALALHRLLAQRLAGYRHALHFGGIAYLFVRGVRPHWRQPDGRPCGVHLHTPTLAALQAVSQALGDDDRTPGSPPP